MRLLGARVRVSLVVTRKSRGNQHTCVHTCAYIFEERVCAWREVCANGILYGRKGECESKKSRVETIRCRRARRGCRRVPTWDNRAGERGGLSIREWRKPRLSSYSRHKPPMQKDSKKGAEERRKRRINGLRSETRTATRDRDETTSCAGGERGDGGMRNGEERI